MSVADVFLEPTARSELLIILNAIPWEGNYYTHRHLILLSNMASKGLRHTVLHIFKHFWACGGFFIYIFILLWSFYGNSHLASTEGSLQRRGLVVIHQRTCAKPKSSFWLFSVDEFGGTNFGLWREHTVIDPLLVSMRETAQYQICWSALQTSFYFWKLLPECWHLE